MGLRYVNDTEQGITALYDSVSGWAFGPTFGSETKAEQFLDWCKAQGVKNGDVRAISLLELEELESRYYAEHADEAEA